MLRTFAILTAPFAAALCASGSAAAAAPKAAVFDFELVDTSLDGAMLGASEVEAKRIAMLSDRLRSALAGSGEYDVVDIAPVRAEAANRNLQACGGCDRHMAAELGAELAVTGVVHKVSNLILNINLYVRDVETGSLVEGYSADIRSNTDESWTRGLDWLLENRLLAPEATR
jgi:hypothetical protein